MSAPAWSGISPRPSLPPTPPPVVKEPVTIGLTRVREGNLDPDFDVQAIIHADRRQKKDAKQQERRERPALRKGRPKNRDGADKDKQEN